MKIPTQKQLDKAYREAVAVHKKYLARHGVKLPGETTYKATWLAMLMHYHAKDRSRPVHKDEISGAVRRRHPQAGHDQQVRHLKRDGWNVIGSRGSHRLDPYRPSPQFVNEQARKRGRLAAGSFDKLKEAFGHSCATCGAAEGRPDVRYGGDDIVLQQGHQNPAKPGDDLKNIIPQCQFCNRSYKSDFTFDNKGRVRAVAAVGPVQRAGKEVQRAIFEWLKGEFS